MREKKRPYLCVQNLMVSDPDQTPVGSFDQVVSESFVHQDAVGWLARRVPLEVVLRVVLVENSESHYEVFKTPHFLQSHYRSHHAMPCRSPNEGGSNLGRLSILEED